MPNLKGVITLAELHEQRCYLDLNSRQRKMVDKFIETEGDRTEAVISAGYHFKNRENAHRFAHQYFARLRIKQCLTFYQGIGEKEQFIADLTQASRNKHINPAQAAVLRLRAQVLGIVPVSRSAAETVAEQAESSVPAETRFKVGDICVRDGKKYRITRVDENGQALSGDELS